MLHLLGRIIIRLNQPLLVGSLRTLSLGRHGVAQESDVDAQQLNTHAARTTCYLPFSWPNFACFIHPTFQRISAHCKCNLVTNNPKSRSLCHALAVCVVCADFRIAPGCEDERNAELRSDAANTNTWHSTLVTLYVLPAMRIFAPE